MSVPQERDSNLEREYSALSFRERERLSPINSARESNDLMLCMSLIKSLQPPMAYLNHQLQRTILYPQRNLKIARNLLDFGVPIDQGVVNSATLDANKDEIIDVFELLLEYGWGINTQYCYSPILCWAIENDKVVEWLLEHGANPCIGQDPANPGASEHVLQSGEVMEHAARRGSLKTFNLLIEYGARYDLGVPLHAASQAEFTPERKAVIERLLSLGRDINEPDPVLEQYGGATPLIMAATYGHAETIVFLLEHGADPYVKTQWGYTAEDEAIVQSRSKNADALREWCARRKQEQIDGCQQEQTLLRR